MRSSAASQCYSLTFPQVTASSFEEAELSAGFKGVLELLYVRMKTELCDVDLALRSLVREEMPKVVGIVKLVSYLLKKFSYAGKHENIVLSHLSSPISWHEKPPASSETLMVCTPSCKNLYNFIVSLYQGKRDYVFVQMSEENVQKKRSGAAYADNATFNLAEDLEKPFKREKLQMENAVRYAAGVVPPSEPDDAAGAAGADAASSQGAPGAAAGAAVTAASSSQGETGDDDKEDHQNKD